MPPVDDPQSLLAQWGQGKFPRVVLLGGPDLLTKDETLLRLKKAFLGDDPGGMNTDLLDGEDASAGAILSAAHTLPFFGGRRLIVVRRAHSLSTADATRLSDGLAAVPDTNVLALLWDERVDNRSVLVQAVRSVGAVAVFWPPFENRMPGWITDRATALGKKMPAPAARLLLELMGPSLPDLSQEVNKLALYVGERSEITVDDVAQVSSGGRAGFRFMEWERAFWKKEGARTLQLLESLREQGEAPEALFPQLVRALQRLMLGKALLSEGKPRAEVFERLWLRLRDAQEDYQAAVGQWSWNELRSALDRLLEADVAIKTGRTSADAELSRVVVSLCDGGRPLTRR